MGGASSDMVESTPFRVCPNNEVTYSAANWRRLPANEVVQRALSVTNEFHFDVDYDPAIAGELMKGIPRGIGRCINQERQFP